jgi:hypothetical protein
VTDLIRSRGLSAEHDMEDPDCECEACTPDDIVTRLCVAARTAPVSEAPLLNEAAQTIWNLRHGYGG